jgi:O-antigen/teichoic acid export membrane protein
VSTDVVRPQDGAAGGSLDTTLSGTGARVLGGGAWQVASNVAPFLYTTAVSIVAARVLGPVGMGRQSFIAFVVLATMTLCSAGFPGALPRYAGELVGKGREGVLSALAAWAWRIQLVAGLIGALFLIALAALGAEPTAAWLCGAVAVVAGVLHKVPGSLLNGVQRWGQNSMVIIATGAASTVATIIALAAGWGITGMFVVLAATNIAMLVWARVLFSKVLEGITSTRQALGDLRGEIVRFALAASVPMILGFVVFQRSEFFFLERFSSNTQIALYSIAFSVFAVLVAMPVALANTVAPAVATLHGAGAEARIRAGYARGLRLLLFICIPVMAAGYVFGPSLVRLVFGNQYAGAGDILLVLLIPLLVIPLGGLSTGFLYGYGRIRVPVIAGIVATVVDLTLAGLLVPSFEAIGAAVANVCAQLISALVVLLYSIRLVGGVDVAPGHLGKVGLATGAAAAASLGILELGDHAVTLVPAMVVGTIVFALLARGLRILPREDGHWLADTAGRGRPRVRRVFLRLSGAPLGATR